MEERTNAELYWIVNTQDKKTPKNSRFYAFTCSSSAPCHSQEKGQFLIEEYLCDDKLVYWSTKTKRDDEKEKDDSYDDDHDTMRMIYRQNNKKMNEYQYQDTSSSCNI